MFELNTLRAKLQPHLGWHGARTLFVAAFIIALFRDGSGAGYTFAALIAILRDL